MFDDENTSGPIILDWDNVETEFKPLPPGPYSAVITGVELRPSKSSQFPYLNVEFTIQDGPHKGRKAWDIWSLSPKAMPYGFQRYTLRLGVKVAGNQQFGSYAELAAEYTPRLMQVPATIVIRHEEYEGEMRERIHDVLPANAGATGGSATRNTTQAPAGASLL